VYIFEVEFRLQVCQRPSGRLRSRGKNASGFACPHLRHFFSADERDEDR
jgi:hypothetical protein